MIRIETGDPGIDFGRVDHLARSDLGKGGGDHLDLIILLVPARAGYRGGARGAV